MEFNDARQLDQITSDLVFADWPRGINRGQIAALADGEAPLTEEEAEEANVKTNFNDLQQPSLLHECRMTFYNAFFQQGQYITCQSDHPWVPRHKRASWSKIVEHETNRPLIEDVNYDQMMQSKFATLSLHGIGPAIWRNTYEVVPDPLSVSDLLVPTNTLRGFKNLPLIVIRKSFTGMEFENLVLAEKRDPGWNMDYVKRCLKWVDEQMRSGLDRTYNEYYNQERWEQEGKQEAGWLGADRVPTIDVFDIYGFVEASSSRGNESGWVRRIIIDPWSNSGPSNIQPTRRDRKIDKFNKSSFLFTSRDKPVADDWQNIVSCQYADLSAVAPFMHNATRGLGWLTYALCHVANRFMCRTLDSGFEQLMQYFKVNSKDGVQRALKVELSNMGFIDPTITMIGQNERWQPNANYTEMVSGKISQAIEDRVRGWTQQMQPGNAKTEKTKAQWIGELQQMTAMVGAAINLAWRYQKWEDREVFRRLLIPNSKDPMARRCRERCMRQGVPERLLNEFEGWIVEHERMMGQGNQTLALTIASQILSMAGRLPPESQQKANWIYLNALTHNAQLASELAPEQPVAVTSSSQQAVNDYNSCANGVEPEMVPGTNEIEYIVRALKLAETKVGAGLKSPQKMIPAKDLQALSPYVQDIGKHVRILAMDKQQAKLVKAFVKKLTQIAAQLKAFGQRLQAAMKAQQKQQQGNGGGGGELAAKVMPAVIAAKTKAKIKEEEAAQRRKHKDIAFAQEIQHKGVRAKADVAAKDLTTAAEIRRGGMSSLNEDES